MIIPALSLKSTQSPDPPALLKRRKIDEQYFQMCSIFVVFFYLLQDFKA
jgi:hypothetical protein